MAEKHWSEDQGMGLVGDAAEWRRLWEWTGQPSTSQLLSVAEGQGIHFGSVEDLGPRLLATYHVPLLVEAQEITPGQRRLALLLAISAMCLELGSFVLFREPGLSLDQWSQERRRLFTLATYLFLGSGVIPTPVELVQLGLPLGAGAACWTFLTGDRLLSERWQARHVEALRVQAQSG